LALSCVGLVDALKERRADGTALAGAFDHKQPPVDLAGFVDEFGQVAQAAFDAEVVGLVDDRLDPERAAVLEVLLDAAKEILRSYSRMVKSGGKLVYATCSILPQENTEQLTSFLASEEGRSFKMEKEEKIFASRSGFDGFYMARLVKI
jgi:16S rRNA (cytosine967-C5)-methyltransferase